MTDEWITCDCHTHAIKVTRFDDEPHVYLSLWSYGFDQDNRPGLWQRMKNAWAALWRGDFQSNEIVLSPEEAKKLVDVLNFHHKAITEQKN